jgi:Protein of unknown function DUF262
MSDAKHTKTFATLLEGCQQVIVPQIQRDYAQGRDSEREVRDSFLSSLAEALALPAGDERLPLNLDFIYGSMEDGDQHSFQPLDGQQRLTTLFFLHWYLAWRDKQMLQFRDMVWGRKHSRFSYQVRPSSMEFFDALVNFEPGSEPVAVSSLRKLIEDQPWFFMYWRLDPTIQSALTMLDAIHERFRETTELYARLVDQSHPAITFQLLKLERFGLTDDLYIKMNARGMPLTAFETFKARFEELLKTLYPTEHRKLNGKDVSVSMFFASRMDTVWTYFFWSHKDKASDTFDEAVMNLLWALIRISLDPGSPSFTQDTMQLRSSHIGVGFTVFHERGWLTRSFADRLMCLLEAWSTGASGFERQLPSDRYFDEPKFFQRAIDNPATLEYVELVQFAAFVSYIECHAGAVVASELQEWARVISNLSVNSGIDRPEDYGRALSGIQTLLPHSRQILQFLATTDIDLSSFNAQQMREEILKAKLVLAHSGWRPRIDAAEAHGYFRGQIEFLLDFAGVTSEAIEVPVSEWAADMHADFQNRVDDYLAKTEMMFGPTGLQSLSLPGNPYLWERALLVCGDYLSTNRTNYSFLTNPASNWDSWKRYLRGDTSGPSARRRYLKALWDCIDVTRDIAPQLEQFIRGSSGLESWREAVVKHPQVITYCKEREIRKRAYVNEIYLLKRKQMNGTHAELFSYVLHQELSDLEVATSLFPLSIQPYQSVAVIDVEPHFMLKYDSPAGSVCVRIESTKGEFLVSVERAAVKDQPKLESILRDEIGFGEVGEVLACLCPRNEIQAVLQGLARGWAEREDGADEEL